MEVEIRRPSCCKSFFANHWRGVLSIVIPIAFSPIIILNHGKDFRCLWLVAVMAFYWITESVPLYITSLLPLVAFPVMGIMDSESTCMEYFKSSLVMFIAGLIVALAIEYCNLHIRLALRVILIVGCSPRRLHFGLVFTAMFISMWISNSATTVMMCPIVRAVLEELHAQGVVNVYMDESKEPASPEGKKHASKIGMAYYFGIAYAASIGGCGTIIGTGTNLTFIGIYQGRFPNSDDKITFALFMIYCVPLMLINTFVMCIGLQITNLGLFRPNSTVGKEIAASAQGSDVARSIILQKYKDLGPMTIHEVQVAIMFLLMVFLLFTRAPGFMTGWKVLFAKPVTSASVVIFIVIIIFIIPANYAFCKLCGGKGPFEKRQTKSLIVWKFVNTNTAWGLLFLMGGGYALAKGIAVSGMAKMIAHALQILNVCPPSVVQLFCIIAAVFFTAFSSNVAICNILIPIMAEMAVAMEIHPLLLIFPAGLGCSFAFHLPVSTPPNAIIASYSYFKTKYLAVAGIIPTVCAILTLFLNGQTWHYVVYPTTAHFPDWARNSGS